MSRLSRILSQAGLALRKGLGQNFLVNQGILEKIAAASGAGPDSLVLEIGSGLGNLTELLARRSGRVLAVELDKRFAAIHESELGDIKNIDFLYGDFMDLDLPALFAGPALPDLRLVGNIPYHLTSPILFKLLACPVEFQSIALLMQREVAQRIVAEPGSRPYGILAAKLRTRYDADVAFQISPGSFLPPPRVHSALLRLYPRAEGPLTADADEREAYFRFVDSAFAQRRKYFAKGISGAAPDAPSRERVETALTEIGHLPTVRAEDLSPGELLSVFRLLGRPLLPGARERSSRAESH
jgi:16S rRNA (adenine1518-N6/adenine1519-N6)-dimethyltransferase